MSIIQSIGKEFSNLGFEVTFFFEVLILVLYVQYYHWNIWNKRSCHVLDNPIKMYNNEVDNHWSWSCSLVIPPRFKPSITLHLCSYTWFHSRSYATMWHVTQASTQGNTLLNCNIMCYKIIFRPSCVIIFEAWE